MKYQGLAYQVSLLRAAAFHDGTAIRKLTFKQPLRYSEEAFRCCCLTTSLTVPVASGS